MKKMIVLILSIAMTLSLCACGKDDYTAPSQLSTATPTDPTTGSNNDGGENNGDSENNGEDSTKTDNIYLRTKATEYDKNGEWIRTVEYEYNDQGSPTEIKMTLPDFDYSEYWDEALQIYITDRTPNGGKVVSTFTYQYNDQGHCQSYEDITEVFSQDGTLKSKRTNNSTKNYGYKYEYNLDGTIDTVAYRDTMGIDDMGEYIGKYVYHYDDNGRLHEISNRDEKRGVERPVADFRYNSKGQLTASSVRSLEAMRLWQYEYDEKGNLEQLIFTMELGEAPFDNEHITGYKLDEWPFALKSPYSDIEFKYDNNGRVISRGYHDNDGDWHENVGLEYDGKKLSRVVYIHADGNKTIQITEDEAEAMRMAKEINDGDVAMVRDCYGNIIKVIEAGGYYTEYEYKAISLIEQHAQQHSSIMFAVHGVNLSGGQGFNQVQVYTGGYGLYSYVSFPTNELYEIEAILNSSY